MDLQVTDVPDEQRFEIRADGELAAVIVYHMRGSAIAFLHTAVLPSGKHALGPMPRYNFSVADATAIVVYLRSLK